MNKCPDCCHSRHDFAPATPYDSGWSDWECHHPTVLQMDHVTGIEHPAPCREIRNAKHDCDLYKGSRVLFYEICKIGSLVTKIPSVKRP